MQTPSPGGHGGRRVVEIRSAPRLLAVGDVQGNAQPLWALLLRSGWVGGHPEAPTWKAGEGTLLFTGDLVDGGAEPAETLDLITAVDGAARAARGRLVLLKGNHELMMLAALADTSAPATEQWFSEGGLETLLRLGHAGGFQPSETLVARIFTPRFGDPPDPEEVLTLTNVVRERHSEALGLLNDARAAALVNGGVLAFHGAPNERAASFESFVANEAEERRVAWDRQWLSCWSAENPGDLAERMAALKKRLDRPGHVDVRHVVFGHNEVDEFAVAGSRGRQFRIGRLLPESETVPGLYCLTTAPREVPKGGALGGLEFSRDGVVAVYGARVQGEERVYPDVEVFASRAPGFDGASLVVR